MNNIPLYRLIKYLQFYKRDISIVIISLACVSFSLLFIGGVIKYLIDEGLNNNSSNIINQTIIILCLIIIIFGISSFFRSYFINNIAEKIINKMRIDVYANLLHKEIYYFEELKIGDTISRLTTDLEHIAKLITNFLSFFLRNLIMLIGAIILMFFQTYKLTLIVLIVIPLLLIPFIRFGKYVRNLAKNALIQQGEIVSNIEETFLNVRTIYTFNQQNNKILEFEKKIQTYLNQSSSRLKYRSFFFALAISIILTSIIFVIWLGSIDIINGKMTPGQMISFIYYSVIAGMSGGGIAELLSDIHTPLAALKRVFELLRSDPLLPYPDSLISVKTNSLLDYRINKTLEPSIKLDRVNFFYPSHKDIKIINNLSFQINNNSFIGIVGRSGAGKSTIMYMLMKFYLPFDGQIEVNGEDILAIESGKLRSLIAYIPQEPSMFSGTIKSNIVFSKPEASEEEINKIADLLGIMDFAQNFKNGLETEIGQRGIKLSGGQKQRIAIARALIYKPQILLLDEATSNLDSESEQKVLAIIRELMRGRIIISISHRISCLEQADEILVIDKGNLTAKGTHKELLKKSNIYKILCDEQLIS